MTRQAALPALLLLLVLTGCGRREAPDIPDGVQTGQTVSGTVRYSFGNTVGPQRLCDYYLDPGRGVSVFINYPDYGRSDGDGTAELIRQTAYNGWTMEALTERPHTSVTVDYEVTRCDMAYFSAAFLFFYVTQGGAYPSSSEYAVTIDRRTDEPVRLSGLLDLSGPEDLARLIPETFTALGNWSDQPSLEELADLCADSPAWNEGGGFYLTEDSLCLIVSDGRYDYVLEAPLASLPLLTEP